MAKNWERQGGRTEANKDVQRWRASWRGGGIAGAIIVCVAGCGAEKETETLVESQTHLLTDSTGLVSVAISQCSPVAFLGGVGTARCGVPTGYVLVGGGGRIVGEPEPGALLQVTRPDGQEWLVQAKDHVHPSAYQLQVATIGLKLQGVSQSDLLGMVRVDSYNSAVPTHHPSIGVTVDGCSFSGCLDRVILGGGAAVHDTGGQQLLTASEPETLLDPNPNDPPTSFHNATGWFAASKDHEISYLDTVDVYLITMPSCPAGFTGCLTTTTDLGAGSSEHTGYNSSSQTRTGAILGGGGDASYDPSAGRMLTAIWPTDLNAGNQSTLFVESKDHDIPDVNQVSSSHLEISVGL